MEEDKESNRNTCFVYECMPDKVCEENVKKASIPLAVHYNTFNL